MTTADNAHASVIKENVLYMEEERKKLDYQCKSLKKDLKDYRQQLQQLESRVQDVEKERDDLRQEVYTLRAQKEMEELFMQQKVHKYRRKLKRKTSNEPCYCTSQPIDQSPSPDTNQHVRMQHMETALDLLNKENKELKELVSQLSSNMDQYKTDQESDQRKTEMLKKQIKQREKEIDKRSKFIDSIINPSLKLMKLSGKIVK